MSIEKISRVNDENQEEPINNQFLKRLGYAEEIGKIYTLPDGRQDLFENFIRFCPNPEHIQESIDDFMKLNPEDNDYDAKLSLFKKIVGGYIDYGSLTY